MACKQLSPNPSGIYMQINANTDTVSTMKHNLTNTFNRRYLTVTVTVIDVGLCPCLPVKRVDLYSTRQSQFICQIPIFFSIYIFEYFNFAAVNLVELLDLCLENIS